MLHITHNNFVSKREFDDEVTKRLQAVKEISHVIASQKARAIVKMTPVEQIGRGSAQDEHSA